MDQVAKIIRDWLEEVTKKTLRGAPVDLDQVISLTLRYIKEKNPPRDNWQMVGVASLVTQLEKQSLLYLPLKDFSRLCAGACPQEELEKLLKEPFFQEYLYTNRKICGYDVKRKLGQGAYGSVSMITFDGSVRALKIIPTEPEEGLYPLVEIDITTRIHNPYLVSNDKLLLSEEKTCDIKGYGLVLPLGIGDVGSLSSSLDFVDKILVLYDMLLGLRCLQEQNILHGDLKPANFIAFHPEKKSDVVVDISQALSEVRIDITPFHPYEYRISDFGISRYFDPQSNSFPYEGELYTVTFRPPEGFGKSPHIFTPASDVWALGASFFNLLTGSYVLFSRTETSDITKTITWRMEQYLKGADQGPYRQHIKDKVTPVANVAFLKNTHDILAKMLAFEASKRPPVEELLRHPLFEKLWDQGVPRRNFKVPCMAEILMNSEVRQRLAALNYEGNLDSLLDFGLLDLFKNVTVPPYAIFLAIDLYYQAYPLVVSESLDVKILFLYSITCGGMILKLYGYPGVFGYESLLKHPTTFRYKITNKDLVATERKIIEHLGGKLVRKSYYDYIRTKSQLAALIEMSRRSIDYLTPDDFKGWAEKQPAEGPLISSLTFKEILGMFETSSSGQK